MFIINIMNFTWVWSDYITKVWRNHYKHISVTVVWWNNYKHWYYSNMTWSLQPIDFEHISALTEFPKLISATNNARSILWKSLHVYIWSYWYWLSTIMSATISLVNALYITIKTKLELYWKNWNVLLSTITALNQNC